MADETTGQRVRGLPKPGLPPGRAAGEAAGALVVPDPDSTANKLMRDVLGNKADSPTTVVSDTATAMGYLKGMAAALVPDLSGLVFGGKVTAQEAGSETTEFYISGLIGYGDDFFSDAGVYYIQILKSTNAIQTQTRQITDYVSADGHFTVGAAFSLDVEVDDEILVVHEALVAVGRNDADNATSTTLVRPNEDGSVLEREEQIQDWLHANGVNGPYGNIFFVSPAGSNANPGTSALPFLTLNYAITQCTGSNNDVIVVKPGAYDENTTPYGATCDKAGLTIIGAHPGEATFENSKAAMAIWSIYVTAKNVTIKNLKFIETTVTASGIGTEATANSDLLRIEGCLFIGAMKFGIRTSIHTTIRKCYFEGNTTCGIEINYPQAVIEDNIFNGIVGAAINNSCVADGHDNIVQRNTIYGGGVTATGIVMAGSLNLITNNRIAGCTNWKSDTGANNKWVDNHIESQITAGNSIEKDLSQIYADTQSEIASHALEQSTVLSQIESSADTIVPGDSTTVSEIASSVSGNAMTQSEIKSEIASHALEQSTQLSVILSVVSP